MRGARLDIWLRRINPEEIIRNLNSRIRTSVLGLFLYSSSKMFIFKSQ